MDKLISDPCWNWDILPLMVEVVNRELEDAVSAQGRELKCDHAIRWDAARGLVDRVRNYIDQTREERDKLVKEEQETMNVNAGSNA